ncbi:hypothetical protein BSKO_03423 [Bryopsis sp. KO-2023]|nr:hypothetical protein BSKO_03423 [Bryopsis sp. KO-2023]
MTEIRRYVFGACMWCVVAWLQWFPWKFKDQFGLFGTAILEGPGAYVAPSAVQYLEVKLWSAGLGASSAYETFLKNYRSWSLVIVGLLANVALVYVGVPVFRAVVVISRSPCVKEGRLLCKGLEHDAQKGISFAFSSLLPFWVTVLWIASTRISVTSPQFLGGVLIGVIPGNLFSVLTVSLGMMLHWYRWSWILHGIGLLVKGACTGMLCLRTEEYLSDKVPAL